MKDLKDFIDRNRDEFDVHEPNPQTWNAISSAVSNRSSWWNNLVLWRGAAAVFFLASLALAVYPAIGSKKEKVNLSLQTEFHDLELFYTNEIAEKVNQISDIESFQNEDQYTQDIQKLEAMYQVLREQMRTQPTQKVKDALILNLLVRIDLLNQQLKKLEDKKQADPAAEI